jgi:hypothetical protein
MERISARAEVFCDAVFRLARDGMAANLHLLPHKNNDQHRLLAWQMQRRDLQIDNADGVPFKVTGHFDARFSDGRFCFYRMVDGVSDFKNEFAVRHFQDVETGFAWRVLEVWRGVAPKLEDV